MATKKNNYDNIKNYGFDKIAPSRQRQIASMGGKAVQAKKKRQKTMKELFQCVGGLEVTDYKLKQKMKEMGIPDDEITWAAAVAVSSIMAAIKKNDVKTIEFVLEMLDKDEKGRTATWED